MFLKYLHILCVYFYTNSEDSINLFIKFNFYNDNKILKYHKINLKLNWIDC